MAKIKLKGHDSGTGVLTVTAPNTSTDRTITLPDSTGTLATTADSVGGANGVDFNDNVKARFGAGNDLEIYHDGSNSYIDDTGTGDLRIKGANDLIIQSSTGENMIKCVKDAQVNLYYDNSKKLNTTATGIAVTGGVAIGGTGSANTLDDYEEGTFTPVIGGTSESGQSYAEQTGKYTKIGNMVFCHGYVALSTEGTISGFARLKGFPFTLSGGNNSAVTFAYTKQFGLSADHILEGWVYGTNNIYLYEADHQDDNPTQISAGHILNSSAFAFSFFFTTTD